MNASLLRSCVGVGVCAAFLALTPRASAEQIDLTFVSTTGATNIAFNYNNQTGSATPGPWFWNASPPPNMGSNPIATFCIEVTNLNVVNGQYDVVSPASAPTIGDPAKVDAILAHYGKHYNLDWNNPATAQSDPTFRPFQLALWELVYDGVYDLANPGSNWLGTGAFKSGSSAAGVATTMLNATLGDVAGGVTEFNTRLSGYELVALVNRDGQDQLWLKPGKPVPAPPAVLLAGIGFLALGGRARWLRRTA